MQHLNMNVIIVRQNLIVIRADSSDDGKILSDGGQKNPHKHG